MCILEFEMRSNEPPILNLVIELFYVYAAIITQD